MEFFAPCPRGLESALKTELIGFGADVTSTPPGGVMFEGDDSLVYAANLWSRIASRILIKVAHATYQTEDDIYQLAADVPWEDWFHSRRTLRVDLTAIRSPLQSLQFATLRIKDGIVDRFRQNSGERPSINTHNPDVRVFGFLNGQRVTLYVDTSGEPLFKRGWRAAKEDKGIAPLKENLAAGIVLLSGWQPFGAAPLLDPFCGSGTILIEAAQMALDIAPGISRRFGFENLNGFDAQAWSHAREQATARFQARRKVVESTGYLPIVGSDIDEESIAQSRTNLERAGIQADLVTLNCANVIDANPPTFNVQSQGANSSDTSATALPGVLIGNPPYGERIELINGTFLDFGKRLRDHFGGWQVYLLTSDLKFAGTMGMRERRKTPLFNGPLECRLWGFEIFARNRPAET